MAETIQGSVEILHNGERTGVVGAEWVPKEVPIVLRNLHGIHDMAEVEPQSRPTGRTPEYQWSGKDASNQDVTVLLWEDTPFDETVTRQAIAADVQPEGSEG